MFSGANKGVLCFTFTQSLLWSRLLWIILHTHSVCCYSLLGVLRGFNKWKAELKLTGIGRKRSDKNTVLVRNKWRENLELSCGTAAGMTGTKLSLILRETL